MRILITLLLLISFSFTVQSDEEGPSTIEDLKTDEFLLNGSIWERIEREEKLKSIQCMRAFPHEEFCSCLANQLPLAINMSQYILAVTLSKEKLDYDKLSKDQKKAVDVTIQARESCAAKIE